MVEKSSKGYTFLKRLARVLRQSTPAEETFSILDKKTINLDIGNLCTLECPKCARQGFWNGIRPIPGHIMTVSEFTKVANHFSKITLCGQISDPIFNPNLFEFIKISKDKNRHLMIHSAASHKPMHWYEQAIAEHGKGGWTFGIDGLPKDSHKYRIHQDGEKLWEVAKKAAKGGLKVRWQYIVFKYNENDIDEAMDMAKEYGIEFELNCSSRWSGPDDPLRPTKPEYRIDLW